MDTYKQWYRQESVLVTEHLVAPFVFEIDRFDLISYTVSTVLVIGFTTAAVLLPARRVPKLDAATIMRASASLPQCRSLVFPRCSASHASLR